MKKLIQLILLVSLTPLICQKCDNNEGFNNSEVESDQISLEINLKSMPKEVMQIKGLLFRPEFDTIHFEFESSENMATAIVKGIPCGIWTIKVDAFNSSKEIIYSGMAQVEVLVGMVVPVHLQLTKTGCNQITVTWDDEFVNIPDKYFLIELIKEGVDQNGDGMISYKEAEDQGNLIIDERNISNLTGIEAFINLNTLWIRGTSATEVDISTLTNLVEIMFDGNKLIRLDVSNNTALRNLFCDNNQITGLDVTNNPELIDLYCHDNLIPELDVTNNPKLQVLHFRSNKISSIDVKGNPDITHLNCGGNSLTSLDLSCNNALYLLTIEDMPTLKYVCLPKRNVSIEGGNATIEFSRDCSSECDDNPPTSEIYIPDIAFIYALIEEGVDADNNNFISFEEAESVTSLNLSTKGITDMTGIEAFTNLTNLECKFNAMTTMDLSKNTALTYLNCYTNPLTFLDVSNCTELTYLQCNMNELTSLDVSENINLEFLDCQGNNISNLDISNATALKNLRCGVNNLSSLDVTNNIDLINLVCHENQISELDVSINIALEELCCARNPLTTLDISNNTALKTISIWDIPTLIKICVWTSFFPPEGVSVFDGGSPNINYTTDCSN
jgi:hypothetical protein